MSSVDDILSRLDAVFAKLAFIEADIKGLHDAREVDKKEYREAVILLRSDLARFANQFSTATTDNKKKAIELPILSSSSSGNLPDYGSG